MASGFKGGIKGVAVFTYRNPPAAAVPIDIALVRFTISIGVKVKIGCQLIPGTTFDRAQGAGVGIGESGRIVGIVRNAVTVQVPPNSIKLRQVVHFDEIVTIPVTS